MGNQYPHGIEIPLSSGKRWVISDIHGCYLTYKSLLEQINLQQDDQLFLLGDYINKGPSSLEVLNEIISSGDNIFPLIGNHDKKYLDYLSEPSENKKKELIQLNAAALIELDENSRNSVALFLKSLPYYYVSGEFILVHAGFNFTLDDVFQDQEAMILIKQFNYDPDKVFGKRIIHGHFPKGLKDIYDAINMQRMVLPLDNGCVYRGGMEQVGNLIGLELNQMKIIIQPNID